MKEVVVALIVVKDRKVLLVQQRKARSYGLWSFPGGHVEAGESIDDALTRETSEELSATLTNAKPLRTDMIKSREATDLEFHSFTGNIEGGIAIPPDELLDYGWFSLADIKSKLDQMRHPIVLELAQQLMSRKNI